ncbi:MAG: magnesium/cobalt transporter CorA [Desulfobacterales bacterium]
MKKSRRRKNGDLFRRGKKAGLPPGTPVFVGEQKQQHVITDILHYSGEHLEEIHAATLKDCARLKNRPGITWINVSGIHDAQAVQNMANLFALHPLTAEDISNTAQRPKAEEFDDYLFFALKMLSYDEKANAVLHENVSVILTENCVLSFQEDREGDVLDPLRHRIRSGKGRIRREGTDYLAYAILDAVVDEYFVCLEKLGDYIEEIDEQILTGPDAGHMREIHRLKQEILFLRRAVWPLREEIAALEKSETRLIRGATRIFLRDLRDHSVQIADMVEIIRDIIGNMQDTFLSSTGNRMNEVMKMLTIIGTIFIPLTFIAGIYGMNFENMPELKWKYGYFVLLGLMAAVGVIMLALFKKRNWL